MFVFGVCVLFVCIHTHAVVCKVRCFPPPRVKVKEWNRAWAPLHWSLSSVSHCRVSEQQHNSYWTGLDFRKRPKLNVEMMQSLARKCHLKARGLVQSPRETVWSLKRKGTWAKEHGRLVSGEISFWCCVYPSCRLDFSFILQKENQIQGSPGVIWQDVPSTR